jgi:hypothetical protein
MGLLRHYSNMYWVTEMPQREHLFEGLFMRLVVMASRPGEGVCPNSITFKLYSRAREVYGQVTKDETSNMSSFGIGWWTDYRRRNIRNSSHKRVLM